MLFCYKGCVGGIFNDKFFSVQNNVFVRLHIRLVDQCHWIVLLVFSSIDCVHKLWCVYRLPYLDAVKDTVLILNLLIKVLFYRI